MTGLTPLAGAEPLWTVQAAEIAYLFYGEPGKPVLSISCGQEEGETGHDEIRIEVEVEKGSRPGKARAVLRVDQENGHQDVPLTPLICGGSSECQSQPDGEVYRYETRVPGKTLALEIASQAKVLVDRCAGRQDRRAGGTGRLQEIPCQLPELVRLSGLSFRMRSTKRIRLFVLAAALAATPLLAIADCRCMGCGCKGGPGWRGPDGQCVSWSQLKQLCGNPPGRPCTYEGAKQVCSND